MDHTALVKIALGLHGTLLAAAVAAFYKYGDRSDLFQKSMQATDETKRSIGSSISNGLADSLKSVFRYAESSPSLLVGPDGTPADADYEEIPLNPLESERFREAVRGFVMTNGSSLADYWRLRTSRDSWAFWARWLSWGILSLLLWEAVAAGALIVDALNIATLTERTINFSFLPTALASLCCIGPLPFLLGHHDRVMRIRNKYDDL